MRKRTHLDELLWAYLLTPHVLIELGSYLTAVNKSYYDSLSAASQKSLAFQGGPFQNEELKNFENDPLRDQMVSLRLWDDAAKIEGIKDVTPPASSYRDIVAKHLAASA